MRKQKQIKNSKYFLSYYSSSVYTHFTSYQIEEDPNFFNTITTVFEIGDLLVIVSSLIYYEKHTYFYWNQISQSLCISASAISLL